LGAIETQGFEGELTKLRAGSGHGDVVEILTFECQLRLEKDPSSLKLRWTGDSDSGPQEDPPSLKLRRGKPGFALTSYASRSRSGRKATYQKGSG
jgi:hypothetical protein